MGYENCIVKKGALGTNIGGLVFHSGLFPRRIEHDRSHHLELLYGLVLSGKCRLFSLFLRGFAQFSANIQVLQQMDQFGDRGGLCGDHVLPRLDLCYHHCFYYGRTLSVYLKKEPRFKKSLNLCARH